jgi:thiol-disulfide isomerase/thioredoxin
MFSVAALDDSTVTYSNESMKGKVYLMDFWAVWCGPCIGELPNLEAAHQKYRDEGFTILSLSFDGQPGDVTKFRTEGEHKMPWLHAFVPGGFRSDLATTFQVLGIPKAILIGADGSIVAAEGELRGEALDKTLARVLGHAPEAKPGGGH